MDKDKLKAPLPTGQSLGQRAVRGGIWVFALSITTRLFTLARTIVLARVLAPSDFGLMGIALLAMSALENFSRTGFNTALIQKKENIDAYLDTAWTIQAIRGALLFGILFASASFVGIFFNTPKATAIIRVIAVTELLKGFTNIGVIYFQKELEFNKQFLYKFSGTLADLAVAIPLALILRSVWALVFGLLAGQFVRLIISYVIHPYRPHPSLNQRQFRELFRFGRWVLGSSVILFLLNQGDDAFIGKLLGTTMLGFYQMAYRISNMPTTEITHVISQVTFPAYSRLQDNIPKLRKAYLQTLQVTAFISMPLAGGLFILAPEFTEIFLGQKWMPMVSAMRVLVFWGAIRSIGATTGSVFYAVGRPSILTRLTAFKLVILAMIIYPMSVKWGIMGTSLAVVIAALASNPIASYMVIRIINCTVWAFARSIVFPIVIAITICLLLSILKYYLAPIHIQDLILLAITGILSFLGATYTLEKAVGYGIIPILKERLASV